MMEAARKEEKLFKKLFKDLFVDAKNKDVAKKIIIKIKKSKIQDNYIKNQ